MSEAIHWRPVSEYTEGPALVTSQFYPGWFDIGGTVLGEWRRGYAVSGDIMEHYPTHFAPLNPVSKEKMS